MSGRATTGAEKTDAAPRARSTFLTGAQGLRLQRKCACGGSCQDCGEKKQLLRAARMGAPGKSPEVPPLVHDVLATPGQPLSASARAFMEPRFKHDFGKVRVHTDERAAASARAVDALAYTVGQHIVFDQGQYQPDTPRGQHLLAHELAHTVQQGDAGRAPGQTLTFDSPGHGALEREADSVAVSVLRGPGAPEAHAPVIPHRPVGATLSRMRRWNQNAVPSALASPIATRSGGHAVIGVDYPKASPTSGSAPGTQVAFQIDTFYLPAAKHHFLEDYQKRASSGYLETVVGLSEKSRPEIHLKQDRDDLKQSWLRKVGWSPSNKDTFWQTAATAAGLSPPSGLPCFNAPNGQPCQIDHIIELQLQGTNIRENLIPLEKDNNQNSGTTIYYQLAGIYRELRKRIPSLPEELTLSFKEVQLSGTAPNPDDQCLRIASQVPSVAPAADAYTVQARYDSATFDPAPAGTITNLATTGDTNKNARQLIPGLLLNTLDREHSRQPNDFFIAGLDLERNTRIPTLIELDRPPPTDIYLDVTAKRTLTLRNPKALPQLAFTYPYLSKGLMNLAYDTTKGLSGKGKLTPSLPLLEKAIINVAADFDKGEFTGSIDVPSDKLTLPPGFRVTDSKLGIDLAPEFRPHGTIAFEAGPHKNPLLKGLLTATRDDKGFVANGQVDAHLPFVDSTQGRVEYRDHQWSGSIDVQTRQIPFMKSASLHVDFDDQGAHPSGQVQLELPGGNQVDMKVEQDEKTKQWSYRGQGQLAIPGIEPVMVELTYGAQGLEGQADTKVKLLGMSGALKVGYKKGALFGSGNLAFERDRASGHVKASIDASRKLEGEGSLTYRLTSNLLATAGVELKDGKDLQLSGALRFDKPLTLFKRFANDYTLFEKSLEIPILGVSLGFTSVGIIAVLTGSLSAGYGIGPGTLSNIELLTKFNPLAARPDLALSLGANLDVPMDAHLTLAIRGGVGASIAVASVTGGLTVAGTARLAGGLHAKTNLTYQNKLFSLDAEASLLTQLGLSLGLTADILAKAGPLSKKWVWNLASYSWAPPGMSFGVAAPLHYDSTNGLRPLSAQQLRWTYPKPDVRQLVLSLVRRLTD